MSEIETALGRSLKDLSDDYVYVVVREKRAPIEGTQRVILVPKTAVFNVPPSEKVLIRNIERKCGNGGGQLVDYQKLIDFLRGYGFGADDILNWYYD